MYRVNVDKADVADYHNDVPYHYADIVDDDAGKTTVNAQKSLDTLGDVEYSLESLYSKYVYLNKSLG